MIIAQLIIGITGAARVERTTSAVSKKATEVDFYGEGERGKVYKIGSMQYAPYTGLQHNVELVRLGCTQILPITQDTWDHWMNNPPSFHETMRLNVKNRKAAIKKFKALPEFSKAMAHARDLAYDISGTDNVSIRLT